MSDTIPGIPTQTPVTTSEELPTAAIVCIAVGGYVVLVVIILVIRQCCMARGVCGQWDVCGKEAQPQCCECCISLAESCDCCQSPSISTCLDSICPNRKTYTCVDMILCQCCSGSSGDTCCNCGNCQCSCGCNPNCDDLNCCCFQLHHGPASPRSATSPRNQYPARSPMQQPQLSSSSVQNQHEFQSNNKNIQSPRQQHLPSSIHANRQLPTRPRESIKNIKGQGNDEIIDSPKHKTPVIAGGSLDQNSPRYYQNKRKQTRAKQSGMGLETLQIVQAKKQRSYKHLKSSQELTKDGSLKRSRRLKSDDSLSSDEAVTGMYPLKAIRSQPRLPSTTLS